MSSASGASTGNGPPRDRQAACDDSDVLVSSSTRETQFSVEVNSAAARRRQPGGACFTSSRQSLSRREREAQAGRSIGGSPSSQPSAVLSAEADARPAPAGNAGPSGPSMASSVARMPQDAFSGRGEGWGQGTSAAAQRRREARTGFGSHPGTSAHPPPLPPSKPARRTEVNPFGVDARETRKATRFKLAELEGQLGRSSMASNLRACEFTTFGVSASGGIAVDMDTGLPARQTQHCDHRLCPGCAPIRARRLKDKLRPSMDLHFTTRRHVSDCPGQRSGPNCGCPVTPRLATFTQDDRVGESLRSAMRRLLDAWKKLRRMKRWKALVLGGLVSIELTRNSERGSWHPHLHAILDVRWYDQDDLLEDWRAAMGATGMKIGGARIEEAGMVRGPNGRIPVPDQLGSGVNEVIKYVGKGIELTAVLPSSELRELLDWMRGVRMLRAFGCLYGKGISDMCERCGDSCSRDACDCDCHVVTESDADEFMDVQTGEVIPRSAVQWRSDARTQRAGWSLLEAQWRREGPLQRADFGAG